MAALTDEQIKEAFSLFDSTESGTLVADELVLALKGLGFGDVTLAEASNYIEESTTAKSGKGAASSTTENDESATTTTEAPATTSSEKDAAESSSAPALVSKASPSIDFESFYALVTSKMAAKGSNDELRNAFELFLSVGKEEGAGEGSASDSIDLNVMLAVAKRLGQNDDAELLREIIAEATHDKKGTSISFDDFCSVVELMRGK